MIDVTVKKFSSLSTIPTYANTGDAGADLYSVEAGILYPNERRLIDTGIGFYIPENHVGLIHPRSGIAAKFGISVVNAPGTIDSGYRGSVKVNLINFGVEPFYYNVGDRIAQIVFQEYCHAKFTSVVDVLPESARGSGGHGSTGGFNG